MRKVAIFLIFFLFVSVTTVAASGYFYKLSYRRELLCVLIYSGLISLRSFPEIFKRETIQEN